MHADVVAVYIILLVHVWKQTNASLKTHNHCKQNFLCCNELTLKSILCTRDCQREFAFKLLPSEAVWYKGYLVSSFPHTIFQHYSFLNICLIRNPGFLYNVTRFCWIWIGQGLHVIQINLVGWAWKQLTWSHSGQGDKIIQDLQVNWWHSNL